MSAVSMAISVPERTAMPTSACASAGASLTPSPTIATTRPSPCSLRTRSAFSAGLTSAATQCGGIAASSATARAARDVSPLIMYTSSPCARSCSTTARASGLSASLSRTMPSSRKRAPPPRGARATRTIEWPAASHSVARAASRGQSCAAIQPRLPTSTLHPSTSHSSPSPAAAVNSRGSTVAMDSSRARLQIALPIGCSLPRSAEAQRRRRAVLSTASAPS
mmetsp:Transcript_10644/g.26463  ORF Transcript_10644/g.26463 Transcript_10644/m.26463 type:complete len:222 (+) Transcript_10644:902-1567(+)